ncbi:GDSL-type esterase/lipase family protein, partial [Candidatus Sumerlaeota bacterium]
LIVARDPNANAKKSNSTRIFISDGALWDNREENDGGWFFTRAGEGYVAFRIAGGKGYTAVPSPYENGYYLEFNDIWAPIVIQMAQAKDYNNDFIQFKAAVKGTAVTYDKGKLNYTALSGDTYEYWSRSKTLPRRNGKTIDLNPEMVYDFPYLKMKHGEDQATISYPGYPDLVVPANRRGKEAKKGITMGVTIGLIGDSTVAKQSGWGPAFASRFNGEAQILNYAKNGATLQALTKKLDQLVNLHPDYVLIQFGHNDQKRYDTREYGRRLQSYIDRIQKSGGKPVIVSSVVRRSFGKDGRIVSRNHDSYKAGLAAYAKAAEAVAQKNSLPFIDLYTLSEAHHNAIGRAASMTYNFKDGDRTHFNKKGGQAITDLILPELKKVAPELTTCLVVNKNPSAEKEVGDTMKKKIKNPKEQKAFKEALNGDWETDIATLTYHARQLRKLLHDDPYRPKYHFLPPEGFWNDINGTIYRKGRYHLFYLSRTVNPELNKKLEEIKGQRPVMETWGHSSSIDLVHWVHHPFALVPAYDGSMPRGIYSGDMMDNMDVPTIIV